jgi:hypothetical protein
MSWLVSGSRVMLSPGGTRERTRLPMLHAQMLRLVELLKR